MPVLIILSLVSKAAVLVKEQNRWSKKMLVPFLATFSLLAIYLLAMFYTSDTKEGFSIIETSLSLLVFPLLFLTGGFFVPNERQKILQWFVVGCLAAMVLCLGQAAYEYYHEKADMAKGIVRDNFGYYFFFSARLSPWVHPSYEAMYAMFAISVVYFVPMKRALAFIFVPLLLIFMLLLSSKSGFITLGLFGVFVFVHQVFFRKNIWTPVIAVVIFAAAFVFLYKNVPEFSYKINMAVEALTGNDGSDEESSAARIKVWKASTHLIAQKPWAGVGTGDVKGELQKEYIARGMLLEAERGYNCHNQFFQSTLAAGIPGLLALLFFMGYPLVLAIRKRSAFVICWIVLLLVNFLVESMLQTQAGVIFCVFFTVFLTRMLLESESAGTKSIIANHD